MRISSATYSKTVQLDNGSWVKHEVSYTEVESAEIALATAKKDIENAISVLGGETKVEKPAPLKEAPAAEEKAPEVKVPPKKKVADKKKSKGTKASKEVPYDRTNDKLKQEFAGLLSEILPTWKQDAKVECGGLSKSLDGVSMLSDDGTILDSFRKAITDVLAPFLGNDGSEEDEGL